MYQLENGFNGTGSQKTTPGAPGHRDRWKRGNSGGFVYCRETCRIVRVEFLRGAKSRIP